MRDGLVAEEVERGRRRGEIDFAARRRRTGGLGGAAAIFDREVTGHLVGEPDEQFLIVRRGGAIVAGLHVGFDEHGLAARGEPEKQQGQHGQDMGHVGEHRRSGGDGKLGPQAIARDQNGKM